MGLKVREQNKNQPIQRWVLFRPLGPIVKQLFNVGTQDVLLLLKISVEGGAAHSGFFAQLADGDLRQGLLLQQGQQGPGELLHHIGVAALVAHG